MNATSRGPGAVLTEVIVYALGGAAQRAALLALVPILGHILDADDYGRWTIFLALLPMLSSIIDFGFSKAIGRFYFDFDDSPAQLAAFLKRMIWLRILGFVALTLPILCALNFAWPILTGGELAPGMFIVPLLIACASESILLAITAFSRARHLSSVFGILRLGQGLLTVALPFAFAREGGLQGAVIGLAAANIIIATGGLAWIFFWIARQPTLDVEPSRYSGAGSIIRYSAPVVVHDLSWWIRNSSTLIVLSHFVVASLVGAYSIGFAALSLVAMLCWSLDFATAPYYYRWRKQDKDWRENSRDILLLMNGLVFVVCAIGILLFADARSFVFGTKFVEADTVGPLLLVAGMFQPLYFMTVKPYFYLKRTALLSRITFTTSAVLVVGSIATIWHYGYVAAAAMTILSYASVAAVGYWLSLRIEPAPFDFAEALIPSLACATMAALVLLFDLSLGPKLCLCLLVVVGAARFAILRPLKTLQRRNAFRI